MQQQKGGRRRSSRVTRADVAKLAGVSTATVSYVLNNTNKVPEPTATRVLDAAKQLRYRPNQIARSLVTNESKQLAIVLNNIANPIYSDLILGFENDAIQHGYFVNICTGNRNVDDYFDNFASRGLDGLFIEVLPYKYHTEKLSELLDADIRMVVFGNIGIDLKTISCLETDYIDAMAQAVEHLSGLGHERIVHVSGLDESHSFDRRIDGYLRAMAKSVPRAEPVVIAPQENLLTSIEDGYELTRRLLSTRRSFTAVICTNDLMAIGAMRALTDQGRRIPEDVSVVGIDNAYVSQLCSPTLTTLATDYRALGSRAFQMLYGDLTTDTKGFYLNRARLITRESTGPVR